jgi:hypothetical protein
MASDFTFFSVLISFGAAERHFPGFCFQACNRCSYRGERPQNLAKHIALVHAKLDEFLMNPDLVRTRREEILSKPKKISIGSVCPVCKQSITKRDRWVRIGWKSY